jgi:hypothetical protein
MSASREYAYSDVRGPKVGVPESLEFELFIQRPSVRVLVSREAMDDHAALVGISINNLAEGYVEFLQTYQSDFASTAFRKHRMQETVAITSGDVVQ